MVYCADGTWLGDHTVWAEDAALMCVIHAMAPQCFDYVQRAAEKGGKEAQQIVEAFNRARASINKSPEELTRLRRKQR